MQKQGNLSDLMKMSELLKKKNDAMNNEPVTSNTTLRSNTMNPFKSGVE